MSECDQRKKRICGCNYKKIVIIIIKKTKSLQSRWDNSNKKCGDLQLIQV